MYDYKFRQSDLSFKERKRTWKRSLVLMVGLALVAGTLYGVVHLRLFSQDDSEVPGTNSDIIPLPLPAGSESEETTKRTDVDSGPPAEASAGSAFPKTMKPLRSGNEDRSSAITEGGAATTESGPVQTLDGGAVLVDGEKGIWIEYEVTPGDSLAKIFQDNELSPQLLQNILHSGNEAKLLETIRPEDKLSIHLDGERQFTELDLQLDALQSVRFAATDSGIEATKIRTETRTKTAATTGVIDHTLFASAGKAGLSDAVTMQLIKIFGWDIDFALEVRRGDRFTVVYEELWAGGKSVGSGEILAAEFVNQGRSHRAIRFKDAHGKTDYYSPDGMPLKKTFFRTPVEFTRISSGFSKRRWHPIRKCWRAHKGVDYAAPSGTPIIATGDGRVEYRGWKKGYGRVVRLRHGAKYQTLYGHMSRFAKGLSKGDRVKQGDVIGYVGQSGLATGPHLHYEFRVNGVHRNPLTVKAPIADPLPRREMEKFRKIAKPLLASLEQAASDTVLADAR